VPEAGASLLLPQLVGPQKAAELILLGESFDAQTAAELRIINKVIEAENLLAFALTQAKKLAAQPPLALQASRQLLRSNNAQIKLQMQAELDQFDVRLASDEAKARFQAFLKK
jgi:enoyl-CoA hydratase/carnithine racemase